MRGELSERHRRLGEAVEVAVERLSGDATLAKLDATAQAAVLREVGLVVPEPL